MAITAPSSQLLLAFMMLEEFEDSIDEFVPLALQQSIDLMFLATGLIEDPSDPQELRILQNGILAMSEYLISTQPYRSANYSPLSSERLGSYNYSKAASTVKSGEPTEVMWFDLAVRFFLQGDTTALALVSSTKVFDYDDELLNEYTDGTRRVLGPVDQITADYLRPFG